MSDSDKDIVKAGDGDDQLDKRVAGQLIMMKPGSPIAAFIDDLREAVNLVIPVKQQGAAAFRHMRPVFEVQGDMNTLDYEQLIEGRRKFQEGAIADTEAEQNPEIKAAKGMWLLLDTIGELREQLAEGTVGTIQVPDSSFKIYGPDGSVRDAADVSEDETVIPFSMPMVTEIPPEERRNLSDANAQVLAGGQETLKQFGEMLEDKLRPLLQMDDDARAAAVEAIDDEMERKYTEAALRAKATLDRGLLLPGVQSPDIGLEGGRR